MSVRCNDLEVKGGRMNINSDLDSFSKCVFLNVQLEINGRTDVGIFFECGFIGGNAAILHRGYFVNCVFEQSADAVLRRPLK